jgi:hypothetical protein
MNLMVDVLRGLDRGVVVQKHQLTSIWPQA